MEDKRICLCKNCIEAIRSRGEKVWVGSEIETEDEELVCEWCEYEDILYDCRF